ncbi:creatininase family protein [Pseudoroseicyclus aestuarii]|uniref:Creatinine amidohydrolase n=1 Tax=Pseudoroseicyclus aestuarii TaxID=1795041 RepID=A0A318SUS9_9RHOB|nr:creatininase family protein [Pseudoroseicyclus aestuarii]PYE82560.1 creatinine amidohydrolase [Pseudoroseicyclus aestuarii]
MRITEANWFEVEEYLKTDDRAVLPLGSTEQHAHLSLSVDSILSEKVAADAARPLGVPVFPALAYGLTPYFMGYPGTVSLKLATYAAVVRDILDSLYATGFRRVLIVNGHGGNSPVQPVCAEWMEAHEGARCRFHDWWRAPRTWETVQSIDPVASHASWMENFPWTRLPGRDLPQEQKPFVPFDRLRDRDAAGVRALIGDGNYGGYYQRPDADTDRLWEVAVEETRAQLEGDWE